MKPLYQPRAWTLFAILAISARADVLVRYDFDNTLDPSTPAPGVNASSAVLRSPGTGDNDNELLSSAFVSRSTASNGGTATSGFGGKNQDNNLPAPVSFTITAAETHDLEIESIRVLATFSGGTNCDQRSGYGALADTPTYAEWVGWSNGTNRDVTSSLPGGFITLLAGESETFYVDFARQAASGNYTITVDAIEVNGLSFLLAEDPLIVNYTTTDATYIAGDAIDTNSPTVENGTTTGFTVDPSLPAGLMFDLSTGEITGTPTAAAADATYTVTATFDSADTSEFPLQIEVIEPNLSGYSPDQSTTSAGQNIVTMNPVTVGSTLPLSYAITPPLPAGLNFDTTTGAISGAATVAHPTTIHTVTADYEDYTDTTAEVTITVNAPQFDGYVDQNEYLLGTLSPMRTAPPKLVGIAPTGFTVNPPLPAGLMIDSVTGSISGTPSAATPETAYTVTANYASFPSVDQDIIITTVDAITDDFNNASGPIGALSNWTTQLTGNSDIEFAINAANGWIAGSPSGTRYGIAGATATNDLTALPSESDFTVSVRMSSSGNFVGGGLTFGYVPESDGFVSGGDPDGENDSFWTFQIEYNGGSPAVVVNTRDGAVNNAIITDPTGPYLTDDSFYTMMVSYDAETTNLEFTIIAPDSSTYYHSVYSLDESDFQIATGSLIGIQERSSFRIGYEDFQVNFDEVDIADPVISAYDIWLEPSFLTGEDADFDLDFDLDGQTNGEEWYFFNTYPEIANSFSAPLSSIAHSGNGTFTFTHNRPVDRTGTTDTYEWSTSLNGGWNENGASDGGVTVTISAVADDPDLNPDPDYESVTVTVTTSPNATPKVFVRMNITEDTP